MLVLFLYKSYVFPLLNIIKSTEPGKQQKYNIIPNKNMYVIL